MDLKASSCGGVLSLNPNQMTDNQPEIYIPKNSTNDTMYRYMLEPERSVSREPAQRGREAVTVLSRDSGSDRCRQLLT